MVATNEQPARRENYKTLFVGVVHELPGPNQLLFPCVPTVVAVAALSDLDYILASQENAAIRRI